MKNKKIIVALAVGVASFSMLAQASTCTVLGVQQPDGVYDGPTSCDSVKLVDITVRGPLIMRKTIVKGTTDVSGPLTASGSSLSTVQLENQITPVKVKLDSTNVSGNVTFIGTEGTVYLSGGSKISGKVVNGTVVNN